MKILVTGAYGQLGSELQTLEEKYSNWQFLFTDADTLDITDGKAISEFFEMHSPEFIINGAAYTAVDKAESETDAANMVNTVAPGLLAAEAKKYDAGFIHVSTDYVFDGNHFQPYTEEDKVNPKAFYGESKLKGEQNCFAENANTVVIRTAWLYSSFGNNFVKTMLRLGKERDELNVVYDQVGSPTYAGDLAQAIIAIAAKYEKNSGDFIPGVYHYSNEGAISWYDFAKSIFEITGLKCTVNPILSKEFKMDAPRPFYSVLDKSKIKNNFQLKIPYWKDSLEICLEKLLKTK